MTDPSAARKAAEQRAKELFNERGHGFAAGMAKSPSLTVVSKETAIEFAVALALELSAACSQPVAPPDLRDKCVNFISRNPYPSANDLKDFVVSLGAAPAVSTPRCPKCRKESVCLMRHNALEVENVALVHCYGCGQDFKLSYMHDFRQFFQPAPSPPSSIKIFCKFCGSREHSSESHPNIPGPIAPPKWCEECHGHYAGDFLIHERGCSKRSAVASSPGESK